MQLYLEEKQSPKSALKLCADLLQCDWQILKVSK